MMIFFKSKLSSSTLVEVIVAMLILSLLTGVFFNFLGSLKRDQNIELKVLANIEIDKLSQLAFQESKIQEGEFKIESITLKCKEDSSGFNNIRCLSYKAFSNTGKLLAEKKIYIIKK